MAATMANTVEVGPILVPALKTGPDAVVDTDEEGFPEIEPVMEACEVSGVELKETMPALLVP